jgi:hypothetical protein
MKTSSQILRLLGCAFLVLVVAFQSNAQVKKERNVSNFTGIDVGNAFIVFIKQGNKASLTIDTEEELHSKIVSEVEGGVLKLGMEKSFDWKNWNNRKITVYITCPELNKLAIHGATNVKGESSFKANSFDLNLNGASKLALTLNANTLKSTISGASKLDLKLTVTEMDADISGASHVTISGQADKQTLDLSGASHYEASNLSSKTVAVDASGASKATISVSGELSAEASSASKVNYKGNPKVNNLRTSGAASIHKVG